MNKIVLVFLTAIGGAAALPGIAATRVATEPGFSGYLGLSVSSFRVSSNLIAGDIGNDEITNLEDSPRSQTASNLSPDLAFTYTFDNLSTEVYLGSSVEDFIRFDFTTALGLRHQISGTGVFELASLRSPSPTEIWADPYVTGVERDETDREVNGIRLGWGAIMDSGFDLRISKRDNEVDQENSGAALLAASTISVLEQQSLVRDGDVESTSLTYNWDRGKGQKLSLTASYLRHDLDGEAMSFDGVSLLLTNVTAFSQRFRLATNLLLGRFQHDAENPVFDEKNDKNLGAVTLTLFVSEPFGASGWIANATLGYANQANAIDFYDTSLSLLRVGMLYRF